MSDQQADNELSQADVSADAEGTVSGVAATPDAYVISRVLAQATLDYLAAQPYREVFGLVRAFESLEPLSSAEASETDAHAS